MKMRLLFEEEFFRRIYLVEDRRVTSKFKYRNSYTKRINEVVYVLSSNVVSGAYDPISEVLTLEFKKYMKGGFRVSIGGPRYEYAGITKEVWEAFKDASSKGRFVWAYLRLPKVPYRRIE